MEEATNVQYMQPGFEENPSRSGNASSDGHVRITFISSEPGVVPEPVRQGTPVNSPRNHLMGMTPVRFDTLGNQFVEADPSNRHENWYSYIGQTAGTASGGTSRWANASDTNGNMFVWIPRYAYQIPPRNTGTATAAHPVNIRFLRGTTNVPILGGEEVRNY